MVLKNLPSEIPMYFPTPFFNDVSRAQFLLVSQLSAVLLPSLIYKLFSITISQEKGVPGLPKHSILTS